MRANPARRHWRSRQNETHADEVAGKLEVVGPRGGSRTAEVAGRHGQEQGEIESDKARPVGQSINGRDRDRRRTFYAAAVMRGVGPSARNACQDS